VTGSWDNTDVKSAKVSNLLRGTWRLTVPIREQQSILLSKTLIRNTASRFCRLE
jgi:hypothetical protein